MAQRVPAMKLDVSAPQRFIALGFCRYLKCTLTPVIIKFVKFSNN